jgi:hypothetical protein
MKIIVHWNLKHLKIKKICFQQQRQKSNKNKNLHNRFRINLESFLELNFNVKLCVIKD